jgi:hypothetical protein
MNSNPQRFRFQFTLRTILLGFALISLALVIYRWPWEETTELSRKEKTVTTFRRGWNFRRIQHGPEKEYRIDQNNVAHLRSIRDFVDGEPRSNSLVNDQGIVVLKLHLKDYVPSGPFLNEYEHLHLSGQFENGVRTGEWKYLYKWQGETITVQQQFENDQPSGTWRWKSSTGRELQTATFHEGKLIDWNGTPASDAIDRWCDTNQLKTPVRQALETLIDRRWREIRRVEEWKQLQAKTYEWKLDAFEEKIVLHFPGGDPGFQFAADPSYDLRQGAGRPLIDVLIEESLKESRLPVYRFGIIWIMPIAECELNWQDRSNIGQVNFTPGSSQAAAWTESVVEDLSKEDRDLEWRFQSLFAGTSIQIDAVEFGVPPNSQLPLDSETWTSFIFSRLGAPLSKPQSRRDILGFLLASHNWSCEQRGNVLILHPWPAGETN